MEQHNIEMSVAKQLFYLIERTIPYRSITLDNNEMEDATDLSSSDLIRPPNGLFDSAVNLKLQDANEGMDGLLKQWTSSLKKCFPLSAQNLEFP